MLHIFYNLDLTSISYNCWNIRRKVLKCWKFDEKREITPKWVTDILQNCMVGRSWHAEHVCSLNLTFISNSFWNKGRKVLKCLKFDEKKGNNSIIGNGIYFKIAG